MKNASRSQTKKKMHTINSCMPKQTEKKKTNSISVHVAVKGGQIKISKEEAEVEIGNHGGTKMVTNINKTSQIKCFKCNKFRHFKYECTTKEDEVNLARYEDDEPTVGTTLL